MDQYRCYFIDEAGHICGLEEITCGGDADALGQALAAHQRASYPGFELWCRDRVLYRHASAEDTEEHPSIMAGGTALPGMRSLWGLLRQWSGASG